MRPPTCPLCGARHPTVAQAYYVHKMALPLEYGARWQINLLRELMYMGELNRMVARP